MCSENVRSFESYVTMYMAGWWFHLLVIFGPDAREDLLPNHIINELSNLDQIAINRNSLFHLSLGASTGLEAELSPDRFRLGSLNGDLDMLLEGCRFSSNPCNVGTSLAKLSFSGLRLNLKGQTEMLNPNCSTSTPGSLLSTH